MSFESSESAKAIRNACRAAMSAVIEKYPKRGDSWVEAFTASTCFNLAGAKIKRIEMLLEIRIEESQMTPEEIIAEVQEEAGDALAYIAFGMYLVDKD